MTVRRARTEEQDVDVARAVAPLEPGAAIAQGVGPVPRARGAAEDRPAGQLMDDLGLGAEASDVGVVELVRGAAHSGVVVLGEEVGDHGGAECGSSRSRVTRSGTNTDRRATWRASGTASKLSTVPPVRRRGR